MTPEETKQLLRTQRPDSLATCGYQNLTVTGASIQQLTVPAGTKYAEIKVESATTTGYIMRYVTYKNATPATLPTTTDGMPLTYGDFFDLNNSDAVSEFRVIAISGSHQLHIQYYK